MKEYKEYLLFFIGFLLTTSCSNPPKSDAYKCLSCNLYLDNPDFKKYNLVQIRTAGRKNDPKILMSDVEKLYFSKCIVIVMKDNLYYLINAENENANVTPFSDYQALELFFKENISKDNDLRLHNSQGLYDLLPPRSVCQ